MPEKPDGYTDEHREYLDELRDSGITNMFGAGVYLQDEFSLDRQTARTYLMYWMKSFS